MIFNLGSNTPTYPLFISGVPNATVTITNGKKTLSQVTDASGNTTFARLEKGTWDVTVTSGSESRTLSVEVSKNSGTLNVNAIPEFTYSGDYKIVNDRDSEISNAVKNWKIRFLTSGTLTFTALNGAADGIDVFCVGGGGNGAKLQTYNAGNESMDSTAGGGGSGYTATKKGVSVVANTTIYDIVVGGATGASSGFGVTANGGSNASGYKGGNGGSGGGYRGGNGGSDGSNGGGGDLIGNGAGKGQGTTTREFGEEGATLYAGGGGGTGASGGAGGGGNSNTAGTANTGGGGGGSGSAVRAGGSGIVIIRNAR